MTRGIVPITFNESVLLRFGYYQFISPYVTQQIKEKTYGAALMQINIRDVKNITLKVCSVRKQQEIINKLDSLSERVNTIQFKYQSKLESLEELKKSILQKAFTGELTAINYKLTDIEELDMVAEK